MKVVKKQHKKDDNNEKISNFANQLSLIHLITVEKAIHQKLKKKHS
jgi:hypothetical protein